MDLASAGNDLLKYSIANIRHHGSNNHFSIGKSIDPCFPLLFLFRAFTTSRKSIHSDLVAVLPSCDAGTITTADSGRTMIS